ncbi:glycoside hydrolase 43 family protein [Gilliamella sp. B2923]|uniref:glycoside hydrolase family 43 protein n=1 Tax=Gilliamella sp. B2923 TaxID=2818005 RepID=UPI00226A5DC1|nr:glycoside hydrolase 43 family protein [Gilliamella sp. B2923]MCX8618811.1 glycoside hydrolase 43 family protein [Gilliamella sp. B2923]
MSSNYYHNPIICADYSDPDIIRVGDDFFMVASSFNHLPALPVLHSKDLINWQIINHVFSSFEFGDYDQVQPGKGVWAPSITYHDDKFWVFFSTPDEGIFMCHSTDPWGEWSKPHCVQPALGWIDPCPFWDDDGRAWLVHAFAQSRCGLKHQLQLFEMKTDGSALIGEGKIIYDGTADLPTLEGPKLYKRNGWYYIFAPAGGVETGWQTVLRSDKLTGNWTARNVLFQGNTPINGPHQGGWVELANSQCWFVHFQDANVYGRIVHLQPMYWDDDNWPRIGQTLDDHGAGQPVLSYPKPLVNGESTGDKIQTSDDFEQGKFGLQWQWPANPQPHWLADSEAGLVLNCCPLPIRNGQETLYFAPNLLLQKFAAFQFSAQTEMTFNPTQSGDFAGMIIYGERYAALVVCYDNGEYRLMYRYGWVKDSGVVDEYHQPIAKLDSASCQLKVEVGLNGICQFYYRQSQDSWIALPRQFAAGKGKWVGAKIGMVAATDAGQNMGGNCHFKYFSVVAK